MRNLSRLAAAILIALSGAVVHADTPAAPPQAAANQPIPVADFVKDDGFSELKLSPDGTYVALVVNVGDKTVLAVQQRSDGKLMGHFNLAGKTQVQDFYWVNDHRLIISAGEKFGDLEAPAPTGELYGMDADGSRQSLLIGFRAGHNDAGTHLNVGTQREEVAAFPVAELIPGKPDKLIVRTFPMVGNGDVVTAEELDAVSGRRMPITRAPVPDANFATDVQGNVRFAWGSGADTLEKTYYRDGNGSDWVLVHDQGTDSKLLNPLGFSADGRTAYLQMNEDKGPDGIYAFDVATRKMQLLLRDPVADPDHALFGPHHEMVGVEYADARPRAVFFDENGAAAKLQHGLEAALPGQAVTIEEYAADGNLALVSARSDHSPGDYYVFDQAKKNLDHLLSHREWIDPDRMGEQRPITLTARDGLALHGFLTLPPGSNGKNLPLVVNPHGGPFDVADAWAFDGEAQLLASRGYAVLQVNFRGSSGFGREFVVQGYKQWGGTMQDDLTDATKWAITQGIADPRRICIYGASYGGYAALMGVAKEPDLYRCAVGYVGIYDLPRWFNLDPLQSRKRTNIMKDYIGTDNLQALSPDHLADRIKVPVLLAAGAEDEIAVPAHTELMRDALQKAGKPVEAKIYGGEGHGFYIEANREAFYNSLLAFLQRNIGGEATAH